MQPGSKLTPTAIPADIIARLTVSDADREQHRSNSTS
jgi:hypothetical protein